MARNNTMNLLSLVRSGVPSVLEDIIDRVGLHQEFKIIITTSPKKSIMTNKVVCGIITNREARSGLDIKNTRARQVRVIAIQLRTEEHGANLQVEELAQAFEVYTYFFVMIGFSFCSFRV